MKDKLPSKNRLRTVKSLYDIASSLHRIAKAVQCVKVDDVNQENKPINEKI